VVETPTCPFGVRRTVAIAAEQALARWCCTSSDGQNAPDFGAARSNFGDRSGGKSAMSGYISGIEGDWPVAKVARKYSFRCSCAEDMTCRYEC
jgi:hypothetical protein